MSRLSDKQARFVQEYLIDLNATAAAQRAGYRDPNIGRQLITKNNVSDAIEKAQKTRGIRIGRTACEVLEDIVKLTKEAWEAGDYKSAFRGLEMEGKHLGLFKEKVESENITKIVMEWGE